MTKRAGKGRGGRRPGAGAPRGNQNAFKSGRRVSDVQRRAFLETLDDQQLAGYRDLLAENGRRIPDGELPENGERPRLVALPSRSLKYSHTHRDTQSNNQTDPDREERRAERRRRTEAVAMALQNMGCYRSEDWVNVHRRILGIMEDVLLKREEDRQLRPDSLASQASPVGIFKDAVHDAVMQTAGRVRQCPYCGLKKPFMVLPDPDIEDEDADLDDYMERAE